MSEDWPGRAAHGGTGRGPDRYGDGGGERTRSYGPDDRSTEYLPPAGQRVLAGRYRLEQSQGGAPGMEFHQATDQRDGRPVGVTLFTGRLDEPGARRFLERARPLLAVRHPALVAVLDVGVERGQGWLIRELVDGYTLRGELRRGPLRPPEVSRIGAQTAAALAEAHDHGLTHREVSPDTVVLGRDGRARIAELGVRELVGLTGGGAPPSATYVAPEQVRREPSGPPADVYALGLTLLEALTGRPEYPGPGGQAAAARLTRPPTVPNDVPAPMARALLAMTTTATADRASARQAGSMLDGATSVGVPAGAPIEQPSTSPARRVALIAVPVLVLLLLVAGVVAYASRDTDSTATNPAASGSTATTSPQATRTKAPSSSRSGSDSGSDSSGSGFNLPDLPDASNIQRDVTDKVKDKVKDQVERSFTDQVDDAWQSVKTWFASLF